MKFGTLMLKAILPKRCEFMSKILQLAQEIDNELENLRHRTDYLAIELVNEQKKNRQFLLKLKDLIEEELSNE